MNGTLKSLVVLAALWGAAVVAWAFILIVSASTAGRGHGDSLMAAMATAWGSALVLSVAVIVIGAALAFKWMGSGVGRVLIVLGLTALQVATLLVQVLSVFVVFNR